MEQSTNFRNNNEWTKEILLVANSTPPHMTWVSKTSNLFKNKSHPTILDICKIILFSIPAIILFAIDSMPEADSLLFVVAFFKKVLILFKVKKYRYGSAVAIGVTTRILSNFKISEKTSCKLSYAVVLLNATKFVGGHISSLL